MKPQNVTCPECGGEMVSRLNKRDYTRFWGCKKYPECKGSRNTDGDAPLRHRHESPGHVVGDHEEGALPSDRLKQRDNRRWE